MCERGSVVAVLPACRHGGTDERAGSIARLSSALRADERFGCAGYRLLIQPLPADEGEAIHALSLLMIFVIRELAGKMDGARSRKHMLVGGAGILLGGAFLWLAVRNVNPVDIGTALRKTEPDWLIAAVTVYLASIGLRCLRWGILLRATGSVKWRHAAEALVTGFAVNFVLPGRIGELFRADYSCRIFNMSRFASLGTIVVERVCDGIVLVVALWIGLAWISFTRVAVLPISWIFMVGAVSSVLFGVALILVLVSQRIDLRRFGIMEAIAARWDQLVKGISSVLRTNTTTIVLCSLGVSALDALTLASIVRSFGIGLSAAETLLLLSIASLSTLVPTAPGYRGHIPISVRAGLPDLRLSGDHRHRRSNRRPDFLLRRRGNHRRPRAYGTWQCHHLARPQTGSAGGS